MKPVAIIRHIPCEGPGYLENILRKYKIPIHLIAVDQDETIPRQINHYSGLVIMGGPMSVNDEDAWIKDEIKLIQHTISQGKPVLGHCLGGQFIAKSLGAAVVQNPVKEIGWHPVSSNKDSNLADWTNEFNQAQQVFHWHGETFEIPEGAQRLLSNKHCVNQAFRYKENVLAFQCHIEMTQAMIDEWSTLYKDELSHPNNTIQSKEEMMRSTSLHIHNLNRLAERVYEDWIQYLR